MAFYTGIFSRVLRTTRISKAKPIKVVLARVVPPQDRTKSLLEMDYNNIKKYLKNG